jgi:hypothetical protein
MQSLPPPDGAAILKAVLVPLLDDFQYWFSEAAMLLGRGPILDLSAAEQADLQEQVLMAQAEVGSAKLLVQGTDGKVGIDHAALIPWHQQMLRCWQISAQFRQSQLPQAERER